MKSLLFFLTIYVFFPLTLCEDLLVEEETTKTTTDKPLIIESMEDFEQILEKEGLDAQTLLSRGGIDLQLIQISYLANQAVEAKVKREQPQESAKLFKNVTDLVEALKQTLKDKSNTKKFFKIKGLDQIVHKNYQKYPESFRSKLLELVKTLYDLAPDKLVKELRLNFAATLLELLDDAKTETATRSHIVDVFCFWLPNNTAVQATFLKHKGLEIFHKTMKELDEESVYKILKLFLTIFKEHLEATSKIQRLDNPEKYDEYQRLNFIKILATKPMCLGFVDCFQAIFAYKMTETKVLVPILEIVALLKPYCKKSYRFNTRAVEFIEELRRYIVEPKNQLYLKNMGINVTDFKKVLKEYTTSYKTKKGEF